MPEGLLLSSLVLLLIATTVAIFVSQVPCSSNGVPMQRSYAAADADGPRVVGGFMPEAPKDPPSMPDPGEAAAAQEPVFLSWNFINGVFAGILVLEFVIFPILFWMWFGPGSQMIDAVEKEKTDDEQK